MAIDLNKYKIGNTTTNLDKYKLKKEEPKKISTAVFKSSPGQKETLVSAALKTAGNVLPDAANLLKNVVTGIAKANPFAATQQAVSQIKQIPTAIRNPLQSTAQVAETAAAAVPPIFKNMVDALNAKLKGNEKEVDRQIELFKSNIIEHPVENIAPVIVAADMWSRIGGFKPEFDRAMSTVARPGTKAIETVGKVTKEAGKKFYDITTKMEDSTKAALRRYQASKPTFFERVKNMFTGEEAKVKTKPITESETAARKGLTGTQTRIGVQAERAKNTLWNNSIKPALEKSNKTVDLKEFFSKIEKEIVKSTPDLSKQRAWLDALESIKSDYANVKNVSLLELQNLKSSWTGTIPQKLWKGKEIAGNVNNVRALLSNEARNIIYDTLKGDVRTMYSDYGNLKSIIEFSQKSTHEALGTKSMFKQGYEALIEKVVTPITTGTGKVLYKTGEGLEFLGKPGARTVGEVLGIKSQTKSNPLKPNVEYKNPFNFSQSDKQLIENFDEALENLKNLRNK